MVVTYIVIVAIVAYICGAITKCFIDEIPNKFIPIQNVIIGVVSALICYFCNIETNMLQAFVLCITASMGAGGIADLTKLAKKN